MMQICGVLHQLTDPATIMQDLKETLREIDPGFWAEEERDEAARDVLVEKVGDSVTPSASDYLADMEAECAAALVYIGWQGFQLNLDIFESPVNALLLWGGILRISTGKEDCSQFPAYRSVIAQSMRFMMPCGKGLPMNRI